jgi:hypothetical protein
MPQKPYSNNTLENIKQERLLLNSKIAASVYSKMLTG